MVSYKHVVDDRQTGRQTDLDSLRMLDPSSVYWSNHTAFDSSSIMSTWPKKAERNTTFLFYLPICLCNDTKFKIQNSILIIYRMKDCFPPCQSILDHHTEYIPYPTFEPATNCPLTFLEAVIGSNVGLILSLE